MSDALNLEKMEAAWNRMATDYSEHTELSPSDRHYQELGKLIPASESQLRGLDLGSGLGFALDAILPKIPNARICCLDLSSEMLKGLVGRLERYRTQITPRNESYVKADLGSDQFDFVISAFTVHHLPKQTKLKLFAKIRRALRFGARYFELDGVASAERERSAQASYEQHVAHREGADSGEWNHDICLTIAHEMDLLKAAGFSSVTVPWQDVDDEGSGRAIFIAEK